MKGKRTHGDLIREQIRTDEGLADFIIKHGIEDIFYCREDKECMELAEDLSKPLPEEKCRQCLIRYLGEA